MVLGAGIAGITAAWFLAREGAELTAVDGLSVFKQMRQI
ncbi:MAG: NAD(P)-binding protein [Pseudomonadales bacterium]|nr:NAD(P)-binding protein [Pseudomonadales bacterium]MDP6469659.1 NAD(P)-binding protein [Pseudomonadales bacterium]MDP6828900.1 NAD(P)-binding protein [Pseudomonadales bacterium]